MSTTTATVEAILKERYNTLLQTLMNNDHYTANLFENSKVKGGGIYNGAIIPVITHNNFGIGARLEGGTLPAAGNVGTDRALVNTKTLTGRIQLTVQSINNSKTDADAFEDALTLEMKNISETVLRDLNRQLYGTSNGVLATCGTTTASNTVQLSTSTPASMYRYLEAGQVIDIGTVANPILRAQARTIVSVDVANDQVVISGAAVTTAGTDFLFITGNGGTGANQKEVTGLQTAIDSTGTLFNIDPTVTTRWASYEQAVGGALSETLIQQAMDEVNFNSGEDIDLVILPPAVWRSFNATLVGDRQYVVMTDKDGALAPKYSSGAAQLSVSSYSGNVVLKQDRDCPDDLVFGLSKKNYRKYFTRDWGWDDMDGKVLKPIADQMAYSATWYSQIEYAPLKRNAHFKLSGVTS